tara:strand:+ start:940 stop:1602 length:663 start_codon:yes stop_codon:yes gene_type:complete
MGLLSLKKNDYNPIMVYNIMDTNETDSLQHVIENILTRSTIEPVSEAETIDLTGSSDEEAAVTPIQDRVHLTRIFQRYRGVARGRNRRTYVAFRSARRLFQEEEEQRMMAVEERMFEEDTAMAIRMSMQTYKPQMKTVTKEIIDRRCPTLKARCRHKDKCTVCLEHIKRNEKIKILPCFHYMHAECLVGWYTNGNAVCPICRDKSFETKNRIKKRKRASI